MKNFEKYKNPNDLIKAFFENRSMSSITVSIVQEFAAWREMEAVEEKILPCLFCGGRTYVNEGENGYGDKLYSVNCACGYRTKENYRSRESAVSEHNRIYMAAIAQNEGEK